MEKEIILIFLSVCFLLIPGCNIAIYDYDNEGGQDAPSQPAPPPEPVLPVEPETETPFNLSEYPYFTFPEILKLGKYYNGLSEDGEPGEDQEPFLIINDKIIELNWEDESFSFTADNLTYYSNKTIVTPPYLELMFTNEENLLERLRIDYGINENRTIEVYYSQYDEQGRESVVLFNLTEIDAAGVIYDSVNSDILAFPSFLQPGSYKNGDSHSLTFDSENIVLSYDGNDYNPLKSNYYWVYFFDDETLLNDNLQPAKYNLFYTLDEIQEQFTITPINATSFFLSHINNSESQTLINNMVFTLSEGE